ncbi:MAG: Zn-ribbon domain-containing OB-fold protein [Candidatus Heimdallarchaeaceae archaeon]
MSSDSSNSTIQLYINELKNGKILYNRCDACDANYLPPRQHCPNCSNKELKLHEAPLEGIIISFTIIRVAPTAFVEQAPYAVGIIRLMNDIRIMARVYCENIEDVTIGKNVVAVFDEEKEDSSVLAFKII